MTPYQAPFGTDTIKEILPHRYPFLFIDRVIELKDASAVGIKCVTANEPFFQGHFPGKAVMPGVLIIEAMAQLGGILLLAKPEHRGKLAYLVTIERARFRKPVVPGDQLRIEAELVKFKSRIGVCKARALVDGEEVSDCEIMFSLA